MAPQSEGNGDLETLLRDLEDRSCAHRPPRRIINLEQTLGMYGIGKLILAQTRDKTWDMPHRLLYHTETSTQALREHFSRFVVDCMRAINSYNEARGAYNSYLESRVLLRDLSIHRGSYREYDKDRASYIQMCLISYASAREAKWLGNTISLLYRKDVEVAELIPPSLDRKGMLNTKENLEEYVQATGEDKVPEFLKRLRVFLNANYGDFNSSGGGYNHPFSIKEIQIKNGEPISVIVLAMLPLETSFINRDNEIYTASISGGSGFAGGEGVVIVEYKGLKHKVSKKGSLEEARAFMQKYNADIKLGES